MPLKQRPVAAVVLAAGAATRFGGPKQRLLLPQVLERVRRSAVSDVVVVAGAYELDVADTAVVSCPEWERGLGASLRCGIAALPDEVEAAVVCLADGPNVSPRAIERVVDEWRRSEADVVAATYGGDRGHPVVIGRALWPSIPDEGARVLPATLVACDDLGPPGDVDAPEDIESLDPPLAER